MHSSAFVPSCWSPRSSTAKVSRTSSSSASTPSSLACTLQTNLSLSSKTPSSASSPVPLTASPSPQLTSLAPRPRPSPPAGGSTVVLWLRADLRVHDHPALAHAIELAGPTGSVLPVYVFDTAAFGRTAFGFEKTGRQRALFSCQAVSRLRTTLRNLGSDLHVRVGDPAMEVDALAAAVRATIVVTHATLLPDAAAMEDKLESRLRNRSISFFALWTGTLYNVDDLPFPPSDLPTSYARFRKSVHRNATIRAPLVPPESLPSPPPGAPPSGEIPTLTHLGFDESSVLNANTSNAHSLAPRPSSFSATGANNLSTGVASTDGIVTNAELPKTTRYLGGEDEALRRLDTFVHESKDSQPSAVSLGGDFACRISPWLSIGCISPRRIYADLVAKASPAAQTTTYFELLWRDYFRYMAFKFDRVSKKRQRGIRKQRNTPRGRAFGRTMPAPV